MEGRGGQGRAGGPAETACSASPSAGDEEKRSFEEEKGRQVGEIWSKVKK